MWVNIYEEYVAYSDIFCGKRLCLLIYYRRILYIWFAVGCSNSISNINSMSNSNSSIISNSSMELHVQVLTTGYWPATPPTATLVLPEELTTRMQSFDAFYTNKYQGRRLAWAHALERCVVSARFPKGRKDLEVSLFQVSKIYFCMCDFDKNTFLYNGCGDNLLKLNLCCIYILNCQSINDHATRSSWCFGVSIGTTDCPTTISGTVVIGSSK